MIQRLDGDKRLIESNNSWRKMVKLEDPEESVDELRKAAGLPEITSIPSRVHKTLVFRLITCFLTHSAFTRGMWECRNGWVDTNAPYSGGIGRMNMEKPFARSYWVVPGKFLAGCYPGSLNSHEAEQKLRGLLTCGIRLVVNLMEEDELDHSGIHFVPYEHTLSRLARELGHSITYVRHPIRDLTVPTQAEMIRILDDIDSAIERGLPVYVHCWGGIGRTGTVVGCYLARHGIAVGPEVFRAIKKLRQGDPSAYRNSPEMPEQAQMVLSWTPNE